MRTCWIVDFFVPTVQRVKIKENENRDLPRELKKLWSMEVTVIPVVIGALGMIPIGLVKRMEKLEIRGRTETLQTTVLPEYWEDHWRPEEIYCHSDSSEIPSVYAGGKNLQEIIIITIINNNNNKIWSYEQMVYTQPSICPRKWHTLTPMRLWHTVWSPNLGQKTR